MFGSVTVYLSRTETTFFSRVFIYRGGSWQPRAAGWVIVTGLTPRTQRDICGKRLVVSLRVELGRPRRQVVLPRPSCAGQARC